VALGAVMEPGNVSPLASWKVDPLLYRLTFVASVAVTVLLPQFTVPCTRSATAPLLVAIVTLAPP
jgi:hypothetical protein